MESQDKSDSSNVSNADARRAQPQVREPDELAVRELENSHNAAMHRAESGWIGRIFGSRSEKPGNVALIVILLCFILIFMAFWKTQISSVAQPLEGGLPVPNGTATGSETFFKLLSVVFGIVTLALGYLFGSSDK